MKRYGSADQSEYLVCSTKCIRIHVVKKIFWVVYTLYLTKLKMSSIFLSKYNVLIDNTSKDELKRNLKGIFFAQQQRVETIKEVQRLKN